MKRYGPVLLIAACAIGFAFGVIELFKLRFEVGDVYPEYSSLRSDPLGTMALCESLQKLPGVTVRRDFTTANKMPEGRNTTYLHLAVPRSERDSMPAEVFREVDQFVNGGGRLVISLFPEFSNDSRRSRSYNSDDEDDEDSKKDSDSNRKKDSKDMKDGKKSTPPASKKKKSREPPGEESDLVSLNEHWGVNFVLLNLERGEDQVYEPVRVINQSNLPLPETLDWHSGLVCSNVAGSWKTIYARGTNAVVIERQFGRGSVVIATDSYFTSNEALQKSPHADFLAWLVGVNSRIFFDEAHLGVADESGVAILMRQYRLHWLGAGLILLAALFIWKNSLSLVPPQANAGRQDYVAGKDAASGFVNLLRRSVAPRDLLAVCYGEWKKSTAQTRHYSPARLQQVEAVFQAENALDARDRNPVRAYFQISRILHTRNLASEPLGQRTTDNGPSHEH